MTNYFMYLLVMAGVTYLIRLIPILLFTKKIKNRFILSFLYYVPYSILTAMVIPSIFYACDNVISAIVGFLCAAILAFFNRGLVKIIIYSSIAVLISQILINVVF